MLEGRPATEGLCGGSKGLQPTAAGNPLTKLKRFQRPRLPRGPQGQSKSLWPPRPTCTATCLRGPAPAPAPAAPSSRTVKEHWLGEALGPNPSLSPTGKNSMPRQLPLAGQLLRQDAVRAARGCCSRSPTRDSKASSPKPLNRQHDYHGVVHQRGVEHREPTPRPQSPKP